MNKKLFVSFLVFLITVAMAGFAIATTLVEDTWTPLSGITVGTNPNLAGPIIEDDSVAFSFLGPTGGTISGSVQVRVVDAVDNTLDFYWRVENDANSSDGIDLFRIANFFTSSYNAYYRTDGAGDYGPDSAYLFSGPGGFVNFLFDTGLQPGDSSYFFFLDTDATAYDSSLLFDLATETTISGSYSGYAPAAAPVPEPTTMFLLGTGLAGVAGAARRKKKNQA